MKLILSMFVAALIVMLTAAPAFAQLELKPGVGMTYTDYSKNPETGKFTGRVGYQVGGTLLLGGQTYFEGGVFYATKGVEYQEAGTNVTFNNDVKGFRIPVLVGFNLMPASETSSLGVRIFGGGSAFIVSAVTAEGMTKDDFSSPTYGVFAGAGLDISMFYVDAKYEWSLTDVSKLSTVDVGKSRSLIANAGIRLPL